MPTSEKVCFLAGKTSAGQISPFYWAIPSIKCSIKAHANEETLYVIFILGAMIVPSLKYNISDQVLSDYQVVSTLLIRNLNKNDFAQYVCVAKNTIGKSEESIKIYGKKFKQIGRIQLKSWCIY